MGERHTTLSYSKRLVKEGKVFNGLWLGVENAPDLKPTSLNNAMNLFIILNDQTQVFTSDLGVRSMYDHVN